MNKEKEIKVFIKDTKKRIKTLQAVIEELNDTLIYETCGDEEIYSCCGWNEEDIQKDKIERSMLKKLINEKNRELVQEKRFLRNLEREKYELSF